MSFGAARVEKKITATQEVCYVEQKIPGNEIQFPAKQTECLSDKVSNQI